MELVQVLEKCNSLDDRYNAVIKYMENMGFVFTEERTDHINHHYRIMSNGSSIFVKTNYYRLNLCEADKDKLVLLNLTYELNYKNKTTKELDQVRPYTFDITDDSIFEMAIKHLVGKPKKFEILDASRKVSFHSTYEAINSVIGTDYTGWMKACWPNSQGNGKFRMWFPKLAKEVKGKLEPISSDYLNILSEDWNELIFDDLNENLDENKHSYTGYDLIFAKEPNGGDYIFRGVYVRDVDKSSTNHRVSKRIASKVRLIGDPTYDIELMDTISRKVDINVPLRPNRISESDTGTILYECGNCGITFKDAPRCPECGQLLDTQK